MNETQWQASTFGELVVDVAEVRGTADYSGGAAAVPSDPVELDKCRKIVSHALRRLVNDNPRWTWTKQRVDLVLQSDKTDYIAPWYFAGHVYSDMTYAPGGPRIVIGQITHEDMLSRQSADGNDISGNPTSFCIIPPQERPATPTTQRESRWTIRFHPKPSESYTVRFVAGALPNMLWDLEDRHFAGGSMDRIVRFVCRAEAELDATGSPAPTKPCIETNSIAQ